MMESRESDFFSSLSRQILSYFVLSSVSELYMSGYYLESLICTSRFVLSLEPLCLADCETRMS